MLVNGNVKILLDGVGNSYWNCHLSFKLFKYRKQNWFMDDQMTKIGVYWLFWSVPLILGEFRDDMERKNKVEEPQTGSV
jgi:hypothetical protein